MLLSFIVVIVALLWSTLDVLRKYLSKHVPPIPLVLALTLGHIPFLSDGSFLESESQFHENWFVIGIINILVSTASFVIFVKALQLSPISQVIPLLSLTPVFSSIIGYFFLQEALSGKNKLVLLLSSWLR